MKTLFKFIILILATAGIQANAQEFVSRSFLSGNATNFYVTALTTNTYGATNQYMVNGTLRTNASGVVDVSNWANRDGSAPVGNISISLVGTNAPATNIVTFVFRQVPNSKAGANSGAAANIFTVAVTANGTTPVTITTNVPSTFLQGNKLIRLQTFGSSNAGTNVFVNDVSLNGFSP